MARRPVAVMDAARDTVLTAIAEGHTRRAAASLARVDEDTVRNWEKTDSAFSERLRDAEAKAAARMEGILWTAAPSDPRMALAWLERRSRPDWGKNVHVENSGQLEVTVVRKDTSLPSPDSP